MQSPIKTRSEGSDDARQLPVFKVSNVDSSGGNAEVSSHEKKGVSNQALLTMLHEDFFETSQANITKGSAGKPKVASAL